MDPLSITAGVVGLLGACIKVYVEVGEKLKIFRHYSREVKRIQTKHHCQVQIFRNEIHHLLRIACPDDEATIKEMLEDPEHSQWQSKRLQNQMEMALGKTTEKLLNDVAEDIKTAFTELKGNLRCLDALIEDRREVSTMFLPAQPQGERPCNLQKEANGRLGIQGERVKDTMKRLGGRAKLAWNKSEVENGIKDIRDSIADFQCLRKQAAELSIPASSCNLFTGTGQDRTVAGSRAGLSPEQKKEYGQYGPVRRASKAFHKALALAWSKAPEPTQITSLERHSVKLFLDARADDEVQMDVAIICYGHGHSASQVMQASLARLRIKSRMSPPAAEDEAAAIHAQERRRVRFADKPTLPSPAPSEMQSDASGQGVKLNNLLRTHNICSALSQCSPSKSPCSADCLGYIDTNDQEYFRHTFYNALGTKTEHDLFWSTSGPDALVSMRTALSTPAERSLSLPDQLKLARNLVTAVLKFHSTPWLGELFSLGDISFFKIDHNMSNYLQTLHVGFEFGDTFQRAPPLDPGNCGDMEGVVQTAPTPDSAALEEEAKLQYGIRNLTLWSLGVILLQIGMWRELVDAHDVVGVRKMSSQGSCVLGPRYKELTNKCLDCDFGFGNDLSRPRLQQAVFKGVVCELSDMIRSLDISDD